VKRHRLGRTLRAAAALALLAGWTLALRPQMLGGPATYLVVRGMSMLPTYDTGDFVILRQEPTYAVGDIVGYRVPAGEIGAGRIVLHRIIDVSTAGFVLQGDNNDAPDPWTPTPADVAGRIWIVLPQVGRAIAWLHEPATLASLLTAGVVVFMASRPGPSSSQRRPSDA
jgi:signal peptidase I